MISNMLKSNFQLDFASSVVGILLPLAKQIKLIDIIYGSCRNLIRTLKQFLRAIQGLI